MMELSATWNVSWTGMFWTTLTCLDSSDCTSVSCSESAPLPAPFCSQAFDVNVFGLLAVVQAVVPHMATRGSGKIVNVRKKQHRTFCPFCACVDCEMASYPIQVGSIVGFMPTPWGGVYSATKAAVHNMTDAMRLELAPFGIQVRGQRKGALFVCCLYQQLCGIVWQLCGIVTAFREPKHDSGQVMLVAPGAVRSNIANNVLPRLELDALKASSWTTLML